MRTESLISLLDFHIKPLITTLCSYTSIIALDPTMKMSSNKAAITNSHGTSKTSSHRSPKARAAEPGPRVLLAVLFAEHLWPHLAGEKGPSLQGGYSSEVRNYNAFPRAVVIPVLFSAHFPRLHSWTITAIMMPLPLI